VLFAGSIEGAHRACVLLGIVATCRAVGVPARAYLAWASNAPARIATPSGSRLKRCASRLQETRAAHARFPRDEHPAVADGSLRNVRLLFDLDRQRRACGISATLSK
jgi:hypothetical protein